MLSNELIEKIKNSPRNKDKKTIGIPVEVFFNALESLENEKEFADFMIAVMAYEYSGSIPKELEAEITKNRVVKSMFGVLKGRIDITFESWERMYKQTKNWRKQKTGSENPEIEEIVPVMDNDYIVRRVGNNPDECDIENGVYSGLKDLQGYTMETVVSQILSTTKEQISDILCVYPVDITDKIEKAELIEIQNRLKEKF